MAPSSSWASLERSRDFLDWGPRAIRGTRFVSQSLAVALGSEEGGTTRECPMGCPLSPPVVGEPRGQGRECPYVWPWWARVGCTALPAGACERGGGLLRPWPPGQGCGWHHHWGPCPVLRHLVVGVSRPPTPHPRGKQSRPLRGFPEARALCNLSAFCSAAQALN